MSQIRIGVLRGGPSSEYEVSLHTGVSVLKNLNRDKYIPHDIFIDKKGLWHLHGQAIEPHVLAKRLDVVFNALHGEYGEDGKVQKLLEQHDIPYTGSNSFSSAVSMNKVLSKKSFLQNNIKTPHYKTINKDQYTDTLIHDVFKTFPMPAVVKPVNLGSSVGVSIARNIFELENAINTAFSFSDSIMIEEFIPGIEATCGVVESYKGHDLYTTIPIEIRSMASHFFDYKSKYTDGGSQMICPPNFSENEKKIIEEYTKIAHQVLGLRHYSRSDFIVNPRRGVYILETNTLPGLTEHSLFPHALKQAGTDLSHFIDHLVTLALERK